MTVYIQEPIRAAFLEEAIEKLSEPAINIIEEKCVRCGNYMRYPVIAKREHVEAFEELLKIANEYLKESGAIQAMLQELMNRINDRLNIQ